MQFLSNIFFSSPFFSFLICRSIHLCSVSSTTSSATRTFIGHTDEVNGVCWSPGGTYLASCSDDFTAKIWSVEISPNIRADGLIHDLRGHSKEIYTVRCTPTGPHSTNPEKPLLLCTASFDGTVKVIILNVLGTIFFYHIRLHRYNKWQTSIFL